MNILGSVARIIDAINEFVGIAVSWLALFMVVVQFVVVVMRYVFGISFLMMQESIVYMHAVMLMVAVGYTLLHNGHVRVDIFYGDATPQRKALVDFVGTWLFLIPICVLIWWVAWPFVVDSWAVLERSQEGSGIPGVFLLKTVILVFAVLLSVQGVSMAVRSLFVMAGIEPKRGDGEEEGDMAP